MKEVTSSPQKIETIVVLCFGWIGHTYSVRMIVNRARQLCSGIHKVQEEGVGEEIHGDELH
jgi:hypothetical protein